MKEKKLCLSSTTILICTVSMFLLSNLPRLSLSLYEAANINSIVVCQNKNKVRRGGGGGGLFPLLILSDLQGITPIWYIYVMASVQLLQLVNTSVNFIIYWFVGNFREIFLNIFCPGKFWRVKSQFSQLNQTQTQEIYLSRIVEESSQQIR